MRVAILGGGFTGLSAAYYLRRQGHKVVLFEREVVLGGLAVGFKAPGWSWHLERAYHHLFSNDSDILRFAHDTRFDRIFFSSPETASLYVDAVSSKERSLQEIPRQARDEASFDSRIIPVDTPQDLLRFPLLNLLENLRAGAALAFLKLSPFLPVYERISAEAYLKKYMGAQAYKVLFQDLMRKKFGKYAGNILASFIWARIKKRTKDLGYIEGGFQAFIDHIEKTLKSQGVDLRKGVAVESLERAGEKFRINGELYGAVVSTLPSPLLAKVAGNILPQIYLSRFSKLKFLHAIVLILESRQKLLDKAYWLNICTNKIPAMVAVQHTNLVDKKHYGGNNILYMANYVPLESPLIKMTDKEIFNWYAPQLKQINKNWKLKIKNYYVFKGPFAQPVFDRDFLKNKPEFVTPVKNFFIANLDMTYPYDRGTNYAVKLGREVAELV